MKFVINQTINDSEFRIEFDSNENPPAISVAEALAVIGAYTVGLKNIQLPSVPKEVIKESI